MTDRLGRTSTYKARIQFVYEDKIEAVGPMRIEGLEEIALDIPCLKDYLRHERARLHDFVADTTAPGFVGNVKHAPTSRWGIQTRA